MLAIWMYAACCLLSFEGLQKVFKRLPKQVIKQPIKGLQHVFKMHAKGMQKALTEQKGTD